MFPQYNLVRVRFQSRSSPLKRGGSGGTKLLTFQCSFMGCRYITLLVLIVFIKCSHATFFSARNMLKLLEIKSRPTKRSSHLTMGLFLVKRRHMALRMSPLLDLMANSLASQGESMLSFSKLTLSLPNLHNWEKQYYCIFVYTDK